MHAHAHIHKVLMISSRNEASWSIPGGGLEPNEEPGKTAVREAFEEVSEYLYGKDHQLCMHILHMPIAL